MSEKIVVPVLGESITEATVAKWLKNAGDVVEADEPIVELETDKVNLEVPSPVKGILTEINSKDGSVVEVGALLGSVSESGSAGSVKKEEIKKVEPTQKEDNVIKLDPSKKEPKIFEEKTEEKAEDEPLVLTDEVIEEEAPKTKIEKSEPKTNTENQILSPAVRKIVVENKIDINSVQGSGKDGRVLKGDLISLMGANPQPSERKAQYGQEERIKMTRLRQTIAKRLKQAQENAALLTTFNEVDMTNIMEMRKENQQDFQNRYGIKLGFMSFFTKAVTEAMAYFPQINSQINGDEVLSFEYVDISIAISAPKGLVVPILRNAESMSLAKIEQEIKNLANKARENKLTLEEMTGGTFTITNGGVFGSMMSTPIINPPQSAILGMHNIVERPIAVDGKVEIHPMMYIAMSYDHRIIDGKESVGFLVKVKELLENPERMIFGAKDPMEVLLGV